MDTKDVDAKLLALEVMRLRILLAKERAKNKALNEHIEFLDINYLKVLEENLMLKSR